MKRLADFGPKTAVATAAACPSLSHTEPLPTYLLRMICVVACRCTPGSSCWVSLYYDDT